MKRTGCSFGQPGLLIRGLTLLKEKQTLAIVSDGIPVGLLVQLNQLHLGNICVVSAQAPGISHAQSAQFFKDDMDALTRA